MRGTTHLAAGLAVGALIPDLTLPVAAGIAFGSLLPDIDTQKSIMGRNVFIIPRVIKHRTLTHCLLVAVLFLYVYWPIALGMMTHIILDMCNPDGVPLLYPAKKKFHIPFIWKIAPSGGVVDGIIEGFLWFTTAAFYVHLWFGIPFIFDLIPPISSLVSLTKG